MSGRECRRDRDHGRGGDAAGATDAPRASPTSPPGQRCGGDAWTRRRQTRGQLTTSPEFLRLTCPAACAFLIAASEVRRRGFAPAFHVTSTIAQSGGYAVVPGTMFSAMLRWPETPFFTVQSGITSFPGATLTAPRS